MKKIGVALFAVLFLTVSAVAFASSGVKWLSLKEGREKAKLEKKPMIVDFFYGKGCPRCEALEKNVYGNAPIAKKIMDDFIPIRIDLTKELTKEEENLGNQYDFKSDCLLLFLDQEGNIVKDPGGKRLCFVDTVEPETFVQYLDWVKSMIAKQ